MKPAEREAASYLASALALANTAEFLAGLDRILNEHDRELMSTTEALWRIRALRADLSAANTKLMALCIVQDRPRGDGGPPLLPWRGE
jgi:hypothetical protein